MVFKKGYKPTEEQRRKQSETRERLFREGKISKEQSPEKRKKISETLKGKKHSKQRRENISKGVKESYKKGRVNNHFSKVSKEKIVPRRMYNGKRIYESHYIWFKNTGYFPKKGEVIHHKDFNKLNNDFSNLQLMTNKEHLKLHWSIDNGNN
jgi:hypothetical protein